jgi:mono/diheme cytochrome c family protein
MAATAVVIAFLILGAGVIFVAYSGGPGQAREAYLTRGRGFFKLALPLIYVGIGIVVPALVIAGGDESEGGTGRLADVKPNAVDKRGKQLFKETCATCHSLSAVNARGVTGPNLDEIGQLSKTRVINAIKLGGTGDNRMPAGLLEGKNAEAVAAYLEKVAGQGP